MLHAFQCNLVDITTNNATSYSFKALPLNAIAGCELSHDTKIAITNRAAAGQSAREIEAAENTPKSTIDSLLQRTKQRNTIENQPRSGPYNTRNYS
jgi:hypothetical protein